MQISISRIRDFILQFPSKNCVISAELPSNLTLMRENRCDCQRAGALKVIFGDWGGCFQKFHLVVFVVAVVLVLPRNTGNLEGVVFKFSSSRGSSDFRRSRGFLYHPPSRQLPSSTQILAHLRNEIAQNLTGLNAERKIGTDSSGRMT